MKTIVAVSLCALLGIGCALAEEKTRFEVSAEKGRASILSGPAVKDFSNGSVRLGFAPSKEFQLTLTGSKWDGEISRTDTLVGEFERDINKKRPANSQIGFKNAVLDKRDVSFEQIELGIVRTIQIDPKHWEGFVGLGVGVQKSKAEFTWTGFAPPANDPNVFPEANVEQKNEFLTTVRGGLRYSPVSFVGVQLNFKWIPIAKMFEKNYNGLELNLGVAFRFGKM